MNKLKIKPDLICSICLKPIVADQKANVFWRTRDNGFPMIAIAHSQVCDTPDLWRHYSTWEHLDRFVERQEEMRHYFNVKIWDRSFSEADVKEGLERIFADVPNEYFQFTEEDYLRYHEDSL